MNRCYAFEVECATHKVIAIDYQPIPTDYD